MGKEKPQKLWTSDFETRGLYGAFNVGYTWDGDEGTYHYSPKDFLAHCNAMGIKYKAYQNVDYFHWMDFDARYFVGENLEHLDTGKTLFIDNLITVIKFRRTMGKGFPHFEFRDSWKLFSGGGPADLDSVCKSFNVKTKKLDVTTQFPKYEIHCEQATPYSVCGKECPYISQCKEEYFKVVDQRDEWFLEYLATDCKSLYQVLTEYQRVIDEIAGEHVKLGYTVASTAMKLYKAMEPANYKIVESQKRREENNDCVGMVRKAYAGGRCEAFKRYGRNLHSYDVVSLYPSVMALNQFPIDPTAPTSCTLEQFEQMRRNHPYIIHARVRCPEDLNVPILAMKMEVGKKHEEKFIFPAGELEYYWCSPEFNYALDHGYELLEIKEVIFYGRTHPFFQKYVRELFTIKSTSTGSKKNVAKLLMNSLYGKFGQRDEVHRLKVVSSEELNHMFRATNEDGTPAYHILASKSLSPERFLIEYKGESHMRHNYISLACFITSNARLTLYKGFESCWKLNGQVWYCDTDSIKTDVYIPSGDKLGDFKHEFDLLEGVFLKPKVYACLLGYGAGGNSEGEKLVVKNKGIIAQAVKKLQMKDMRAWLFQDEATVYTEQDGYTRAPKTRALIYGMSENAPIVLKKKQKLKDDKRALDPNLIDTYPLGYVAKGRKDQLGRELKGKGVIHGAIKQEERKAKRYKDSNTAKRADSS